MRPKGHNTIEHYRVDPLRHPIATTLIHRKSEQQIFETCYKYFVAAHKYFIVMRLYVETR
jgi:hypothetical protein